MTQQPEERERPDSLPSRSYRIPTGHGTMFTTVSWQDGKIREVFSTIGRAGGCQRSESEGISRAISVALKYSVPVPEIVKQLRGIQCDHPFHLKDEPGTTVLSVADAIGHVLAKAEMEGAPDAAR